MTLQPPLEGLADNRLSDRAQIVQALSGFRREWQMAVEGRSLLVVNAPIGLILADIADRLELNSQERHAMLGGELTNQVNCLRKQRVGLKRPI